MFSKVLLSTNLGGGLTVSLEFFKKIKGRETIIITY